MTSADPFAAIAGDYDSWFETPLGAYVDGRQLDALRAALDPRSDAEVLEVGAGTGHAVQLLADAGHRVVAVEPSAAMRAVGESRTAGLPVEWVDAVGEDLPFTGGRFSGVVYFATIEFVQDPTAAFREAWRVLAPGGSLVVGYLHAFSSWAAHYQYERLRGAEPWNSAQFFAREDLEELAGAEAEAAYQAAFLSPAAEPPFEDADTAGRRAGNAPAMEVLRRRKPA